MHQTTLSHSAQALAQQIQESFESFADTASREPWNETLIAAYVAFRAVIKNPVPAPLAAEVLGILEERGIREQIPPVYNATLMKYERDIVPRIPRSATWDFILSFPEFLYLDDFLRLALVEYRIAGLAAESPSPASVLFVGGGSFPITPLSFCLLDLARSRGELSALTSLIENCRTASDRELLGSKLKQLSPPGPVSKIQLVAVDRDPQALQHCSHFFSELGVSDRTGTLLSDIIDVGIGKQYTHVVFAASIPEKEKIIPQLLGTVAPGHAVTFVFRVAPEGSLRTLLYEPLPATYFQYLSSQFPGLVPGESYTPAPDELITTSTVSFRYQR